MPQRKSLKERLEAHYYVDKETGCWQWIGAIHNKKGYGTIFLEHIPGTRRTRRMLAHRASWTVHRGPIPPGMDVLHNCRNPNFVGNDNPGCINPDHLYLGTSIENNRDRMEREGYEANRRKPKAA